MKTCVSLLVMIAFAGILLGWLQATEKSDGSSPANVPLQWTGTWGPYQAPGSDTPKRADAKMDCTIERNGDLWQATFEGECSRPYKYTIKMDGRAAGDVLMFKGTTDLGADDGGVFDWIGRANDKEFVGFYTSARYAGVFRLAPKP